jgi:hypothetical protein
MTTATWALIQIAYLVGLCGLTVLARVLLDALQLLHAAGMARVHHHTQETP